MAKKKREWPALPEPLPLDVTDNHTHLPVHEGEIPSPGGVKLSLAEQIGRAVRVRVNRIITVGCSLPDLEPTVQIAREWPEVKAALAIHPNEAALHAGALGQSPDGLEHEQREYHVPLIEALERVSALLSDPEVIAVGETGLDYFRTGPAGREAQKEAFSAHIEMARAHGLPLQVHDRDAHHDTIELLEEVAGKDQPIVFHCFSGDVEMARKVTEKGWYASFAGPITYPANDALREALHELPRSRVLVETDAPYLTPVPYRGCPNASYVMPFTVAQIAAIWEVSLTEAIEQLNKNTRSVYGEW